MFRIVEDFLNAWKYERESTLKVLSVLTDESLTQEVSSGGRNIARLAWHIAHSVPEMLNRTNLNISGAEHSSPAPSSAQEIVSEYELASQSAAEEVKKHWKDTTLLEEDEMYGMQWKRGATLSILINHQAHHRGQLTILMRQAGLKVPGVYGPSKEEWVAYGMEPEE